MQDVNTLFSFDTWVSLDQKSIKIVFFSSYFQIICAILPWFANQLVIVGISETDFWAPPIDWAIGITACSIASFYITLHSENLKIKQTVQNIFDNLIGLQTSQIHIKLTKMLWKTDLIHALIPSINPQINVQQTCQHTWSLKYLSYFKNST